MTPSTPSTPSTLDTPLTYSRVIPARDGFALAATVVEPRLAHGVVVVASATAVPRAYYAKFAARLAEHGIVVVTFDYRGVGGSRPRSLEGFEATMHEWGTLDLAGVLEFVEKSYSALPVAVVGHSIGGLLLGLSGAHARVRGLLAVGAQVGEFRHWPTPSRYGIAFYFFAVLPILTHAFGYAPGKLAGIGEDLPRGVALEWAQWGRTRGHAVGGVEGQARREELARFHGHVCLYGFTDDIFAPREASAQLLELYTGAASRRHVHLPPRALSVPKVGHFGFFRERVGGALWSEAMAFLLDALGERRGAEAA